MQPQILNCMKNFLIGLFALIGTTGISAQTQSITVHSQTTGKEEVIDIPESMQSEMDSLFWDWQSKNYISMGENCKMTSVNPLSAILFIWIVCLVFRLS